MEAYQFGFQQAVHGLVLSDSRLGVWVDPHQARCSKLGLNVISVKSWVSVELIVSEAGASAAAQSYADDQGGDTVEGALDYRLDAGERSGIVEPRYIGHFVVPFDGPGFPSSFGIAVTLTEDPPVVSSS